MEAFQPTISVITIVYNGADYIEGTIRSVLEQDYPHIEYLIIDGASKDNTMEIVKQYSDKIATIVSEPDKGLYDAMNKGLNLATGDFVWFMNAGDRVYKKDTLTKAIAQCDADTGVIYGEVMIVDEDRKALGTRSEISTQKLPDKLSWKSLKRGMVVSHQAFLPLRNIAPLYSTDNLSADIDWVIECLKKSKKNTHTQLILAEYLAGGVSKQKHRQSLKDRYKVLKKHYGFLPNLWNHFFIVVRAGWHWVLRSGKEKY